MNTADSKSNHSDGRERGQPEIVPRLDARATAGPPLDGGVVSLLEFQQGLRTRCAPHTRSALPGLCGARRLAGQMVCELDQHSPYDEDTIEEAFTSLIVFR